MVSVDFPAKRICENTDPVKVWDVWCLVGTHTVVNTYLAGYRMGCTWRERDVLDGIEIATGDPDAAT